MYHRNRICKLLDIDHPVLLAPMAGVSGGKLAAAVTAAGGLGLIGGGYGDEDWLKNEYEAAGNSRYGVGFITWSLARQPHLLDQALSRNPVAIMLSFGDVAPFASRIKASGAILICQVQSVEDARVVAGHGADVIVAQGSEAGGHGADRGLFSLLPGVVDAVADIPVLAAGGLVENRDLQAAAALGASGALIGTRFFASDEALGHPNAKQQLVIRHGEDTVRTSSFDLARKLDWPKPYTVRSLKNSFTEQWHGRDDALRAVQEEVAAGYAQSVQQGDVDRMGIFAGEGLDRISSIDPASVLFERLVAHPVNWR